MLKSREIKEQLSLKSITLTSIAKRFNCSVTNVHRLFDHKATKDGKPSLIRKYIADQIDKSYDEVWS